MTIERDIQPLAPANPERLDEIARQLLEKDTKPESHSAKKSAKPEIAIPQGVFILKYDMPGKEWITKANEMFAGTAAEIPAFEKDEEAHTMHFLRRAALTTAAYKNTNLKSAGILPITPLMSEQLLKAKKTPKKPGDYWEVLALLLYDRSETGQNPKEAKALYESLKSHMTEMGLSESDLDERLLIIDAGLEKDEQMPHGARFVALPGLTTAYAHETLKKTGQDYNFTYGLEHGLPSANKLGRGKRTLYMPDENENIGLRVLYRYRDLDLYARYWDLAVQDGAGRVAVARRA